MKKWQKLLLITIGGAILIMWADGVMLGMAIAGKLSAGFIWIFNGIRTAGWTMLLIGNHNLLKRYKISVETKA